MFESNNYKSFETRHKAKASYLGFQRGNNHEGGKGPTQIVPRRLKNFIILVQFIVIVYLLLS